MKTLAVIGGGPAGTSAAITARQFGASVVIIEATEFPRFRPGESLHPGIETLLEALGADSSLRNAPHLRYQGIWVSWGDIERRFVSFGSDHRGAWSGYQISRAHLDAALLSAAEAAGAEVWRSCKAQALLMRPDGFVAGVITDRGELEAETVIDASGPAGWLARELGVPVAAFSPRLVAHYGYAEGVCSSTELPAIRADQHGWTWLAQIEPYRYHWTRVTQPEYRPARSWLPEEYRYLNVCRTGGADVTWRKAGRLAGAGWFLCGEAGGVLDPSSSHGVLRSLLSGRMAAHLAVAVSRGALNSHEARTSYQRWFDESFDGDVKKMTASYREAGLFGC
jgi:flavin-dependent dehydrogenase